MPCGVNQLTRIPSIASVHSGKARALRYFGRNLAAIPRTPANLRWWLPARSRELACSDYGPRWRCDQLSRERLPDRSGQDPRSCPARRGLRAAGGHRAHGRRPDASPDRKLRRQCHRAPRQGWTGACALVAGATGAAAGADRQTRAHAELLPLDVPTIELAGGSVRCMLAGVHAERIVAS